MFKTFAEPFETSAWSFEKNLDPGCREDVWPQGSADLFSLPPTGETTTTVAPQVPGGVSDGRWHSVQVDYYNKVGRAPRSLPVLGRFCLGNAQLWRV